MVEVCGRGIVSYSLSYRGIQTFQRGYHAMCATGYDNEQSGVAATLRVEPLRGSLRVKKQEHSPERGVSNIQRVVVDGTVTGVDADRGDSVTIWPLRSLRFPIPVRGNAVLACIEE